MINAIHDFIDEGYYTFASLPQEKKRELIYEWSRDADEAAQDDAYSDRNTYTRPLLFFKTKSPDQLERMKAVIEHENLIWREVVDNLSPEMEEAFTKALEE